MMLSPPNCSSSDSILFKVVNPTTEDESGEKITRMKLEQLCQLALDSQAQLQQANLEAPVRRDIVVDKRHRVTEEKARTIENSLAAVEKEKEKLNVDLYELKVIRCYLNLKIYDMVNLNILLNKCPLELMFPLNQYLQIKHC